MGQTIDISNLNYIFYLATTSEFKFDKAIELGEITNTKYQVEGYLHIILHHTPIWRLIREVQFLIWEATREDTTDDDFQDVIPDACDQLLQIAARESPDDFHIAIEELLKDPNLRNLYTEDDDEFLIFYHKTESELYNYYLKYGLDK